MNESFDPYSEWLDIPLQRRPPSHYDLLGLAECEADPALIENAKLDRAELMQRYLNGKDRDVALRLSSEIRVATAVLTDPVAKQRYDDSLRLGNGAAAGRANAEVPPGEKRSTAGDGPREADTNATAAEPKEPDEEEIDFQPISESAPVGPGDLPEWEASDLLTPARALFANPVARVDHLLRVVAGDSNAILHNFLRTTLVLALTAGVVWSFFFANSVVKRRLELAASAPLPANGRRPLVEPPRTAAASSAVPGRPQIVPEEPAPLPDRAMSTEDVAEQLVQARKEIMATEKVSFPIWKEPNPAWIAAAQVTVNRFRGDRDDMLRDKREIGAIDFVNAYLSGGPLAGMLGGPSGAPPGMPPGPPPGFQGNDPPGLPCGGAPPRGPGGATGSAPAPLELPDEFVLTGRISRLRCGPVDAWIEIGPSPGAVRSTPSGPLPFDPQQANPLVHLVGRDLGFELWDFDEGDEVRIAVHHPAVAHHAAPSLDALLHAPAGTAAARAAQALHVFQGEDGRPWPRWVLEADGLEKVNRAASWIHPELGSLHPVANGDDVRSSLRWRSRANGDRFLVKGRFRARFVKNFGPKGYDRIELSLELNNNARLHVVATMRGDAPAAAFADYCQGDEVFADLLAFATPPPTMLGKVLPGPGMQIPLDPFARSSTLQFECVALEKKSDPTTRVAINGPRRASRTQTPAENKPLRLRDDKLVGQEVTLQGRLDKIVRRRGETHLIVTVDDSGDWCEAFCSLPEFFAELADYSEKDHVIVCGTFRSKDSVARVHDGAALVELKSIQRVSDEPSLAEVGKTRLVASFGPKAPDTGFAGLLRDIPDRGEVRKLRAQFNNYSAYRKVVELKDERTGQTINVNFAATNAADFSDYLRDCQVDVAVKATAVPDGLAAMNLRNFKWDGVSIVRTGNHKSLITQSGREAPAADFAKAKKLWEEAARDSTVTKVIAYGSMGTYSAESNKIHIRNLFYQSGKSFVATIGQRDGLAEELEVLRPGDEVQFQITRIKPAAGQQEEFIDWVERLDDEQRVDLQRPERAKKKPAKAKPTKAKSKSKRKK